MNIKQTVADTLGSVIIDLCTQCDALEEHFKGIVEGFTGDPGENRTITKLALDQGEISGEHSELYELWERLASDSSRLADTLNDWC